MSKINELERVETSTSVDTATDSADRGATIDVAAGRSSQAELEPPDPLMEPDGCHGDRLSSAGLKKIYNINQWVKDNLRYDPETGHLFWLITGVRADETSDRGYRNIRLLGKRIRAHKIAWFLVYGIWAESIDHVNCDPTDNRLANLRACTHAENSRNRRRPTTNKSGYKGASFDKTRGLWRAKLKVAGKTKYLGHYDTPEAAHAAYAAALPEFHGDFARAA